MNNQRILWFQDGVKLRAHQDLWGEIDVLTCKLVSLSGNLGFEHLIVDPVAARERLFSQIDLADFTSIIDLSGFFEEDIGVPVISDFHLSRMRLVSSHRLDGSGFLLSLNRDKIKDIIEERDLQKPLIIDDVSWSGRTINEAMNTLGIRPDSATIGTLSVNCGTFGEGKPGAKEFLEQEGSTVVSGSFVNTPEDDGFHLMDFFNLPAIEPAFDVILEVQKIRESIISKPEDKKELEERLKQVFEANRTLLFPNAISTEEVKNLESQGRFIPLGGISKNSFFDINPPNWLLPSFSKRTNWALLQQHREEIVSVLRNFGGIMREGRTVAEEASENLPESSIMLGRGKERL